MLAQSYDDRKSEVEDQYGKSIVYCQPKLDGIRCIVRKEGDEVIVPAITFAASSNCVLYTGAKPIFCDIEEDTLNIDCNKIEDLITKNTFGAPFLLVCQGLIRELLYF